MKKSLNKKILYGVIPFLEFREKDLSFKRKLYISFNTLGLFIVVMYFITYTISHFFYSYKYENKYMQIYANNDIVNDKSFVEAINNAKTELTTSILYTNNYNVKIYIVDSSLYYNLMATPFHMDTVAVNIFDYIHIKNLNIEAHSEKYKYLSKVVVHEIIHTFQANKYGGWIHSALTMPYWVQEGYARYIEEHKIVDNNPTEFLIKNKFRKNYTLYALMIKHAIEKMNKSVDDLHLGKVEYDEVLTSLFQKYNITKEEI